MNTGFFHRYREFLKSSAGNRLETDSSTDERSIRWKIRAYIKSVMALVGVYGAIAPAEGPIVFAKCNADVLQWLYDRLSDEESRNWLIALMAYRALGPRKVRLPTNTPSYWSTLEKIERLSSKGDMIDLGFNGWVLQKTDLRSVGYAIELYARPRSVMNQFILQQYRGVTDGSVVEVRPGDIVIDGGACYGDSALYFAYKCGSHGRVYSFEFVPENVDIFNTNMALNPALSKRIKLIRNPLWSAPDEELFFESYGPSTRVSSASIGGRGSPVFTASVDALVALEAIPHVDFIKMDIEGSEIEALKGAEQAIRHFRPRLAICVYHNVKDFWAIPQWIDKLQLGYQFVLRHFTTYEEETLLFAETT